jgi:hypothetical protein
MLATGASSKVKNIAPSINLSTDCMMATSDRCCCYCRFAAAAAAVAAAALLLLLLLEAVIAVIQWHR